MKSRGTDIVVHNMRGSLTPKPFPAAVRERLVGLPGVAATCNILVELMSVESSEMMIVSGREWGGFSWENLKLTAGRMPNDATERAVLLGVTAASVLEKTIGDRLQIETEELAVVGVVDGGALVENGSVILALPLLQEITGNQQRINAIDVRVASGLGADGLEKLCAEISRRVPEARAEIAGEHIRHSQGYRVIKAMSWGTSLLAILVGILGVMNTMLMTVFERKQEIAILLALGWKRSRVIRMILWESALLGFLGGIVGVLLGWVGVHFLKEAPAVRGLLEPELTFGLMSVAVAMAIAVGVLSGIYPAWRSSRLNPSIALHGG